MDAERKLIRPCTLAESYWLDMTEHSPGIGTIISAFVMKEKNCSVDGSLQRIVNYAMKESIMLRAYGQRKKRRWHWYDSGSMESKHHIVHQSQTDLAPTFQSTNLWLISINKFGPHVQIRLSMHHGLADAISFRSFLYWLQSSLTVLNDKKEDLPPLPQEIRNFYIPIDTHPHSNIIIPLWITKSMVDKFIDRPLRLHVSPLNPSVPGYVSFRLPFDEWKEKCQENAQSRIVAVLSVLYKISYTICSKSKTSGKFLKMTYPLDGRILLEKTQEHFNDQSPKGGMMVIPGNIKCSLPQKEMTWKTIVSHIHTEFKKSNRLLVWSSQFALAPTHSGLSQFLANNLHHKKSLSLFGGVWHHPIWEEPSTTPWRDGVQQTQTNINVFTGPYIPQNEEAWKTEVNGCLNREKQEYKEAIFYCYYKLPLNLHAVCEKEFYNCMREIFTTSFENKGTKSYNES